MDSKNLLLSPSLSHHGINTPLFSLRSEKSSGIGEFLDLKLLIDWLAPLGFDIIQLLPINASGKDPSPYNAISANALNPIYISLLSLPGIDKESDLLKAIQQLNLYNTTERVQYNEVKEKKYTILTAYVERNKKDFLNSSDYIEFSKNSWVIPYATFRALKDHNHWSHFTTWQKEPVSLNDVETHAIIQWLAYQQMESVKAYADQKKLFLMGDIPILVSSDSADVWKNPHLFNTALTAGAPPDMYNKDGQNWGFPLYNYEELEKEDYHFWKERLKAASKLYHIYRIDHIVGFFRIWAIPKEKKANEGHFVPENQAEWGPQGEKMLRLLLDNSPMLPIGEDLGVIPNETRALMHQLGIAGTKVLYWERNWKGDRNFIRFSDYPKDSLTTVSTHDSEPLEMWWRNHPEDAKIFAHFMGWEYDQSLSKDQLREILKRSHHTNSQFHINLLQEYLSLFPELTWEKQDKERINLPGTVSPDNWTYRYKPTIEEMAAHPDLSNTLKEIIS